jgi:penicillin-insensitive murein endopeptidase
VWGLALVLAMPGVPSAAGASSWSKVKATAPGPARAIGGAANGCIAGADMLPATGEGYVNIRRSRNRYYGHPNTVALIEELGTAQARRSDRLIMVGDLSQPRGGLMSSSHRSHQNGLDADIWFRLATSAGSAERDHPEEHDPRSMVAADGFSLSADWGEEQRLLLKSAAENPRVERIFVNAAIKRGLCQSERGDRAWLHKLRPWWGHDAHFHVRIACPKGSPDCEPQAPIPAGDGCGKELAWWFTPEARTPAKKSGKPKAPPPMPQACRALLQGY